MSNIYIEDLYQELLANEREGLPVKEIQAAMVERMTHEMQIGIADRVPEEDLVRAFVSQELGKVREGRKKTGRRSLPILAHAYKHDQLPKDLAILNHAFPVGDGSDRVLKFWTPSALEALIDTVSLNRDYVTQQANETVRDGEILLGAFRSRKVQFLGDLFPSSKAKVPAPKKRVVS